MKISVPEDTALGQNAHSDGSLDGGVRGGAVLGDKVLGYKWLGDKEALALASRTDTARLAQEAAHCRDLGFGNVDYDDPTYPQGWWVYYHWWIERLMQDPAFVNKVKERFTYFKSKEQYLLSKIDEWSQMLGKSVAKNDDIWGTLGVYVWPNPVVFNTYNEEVAYLKSWLEDRLQWMETAISQL